MKKKISPKDLEVWRKFLSSNKPVENKDIDLEQELEIKTDIKKIDLHGYSLNEANKEIKKKVLSCYKQNINKIPSLAEIRKLLNKFIGTIEQLPPMYSALKHQGKPLYSYAREGIDIPRAKRKIMIHKIELLSYQGNNLIISIMCSKGTYIRTLAEDIGDQLNIGGYLIDLRRTKIGNFSIENSISIEAIEQTKNDERIKFLLPTEELLSEYKNIVLNSKEEIAIKDGRIIEIKEKIPGMYRLYSSNNDFIGLGEIDKTESLKVKRLKSLKN